MICSLNQSYVLILLKVTHGLNTLINENPLCLMRFFDQLRQLLQVAGERLGDKGGAGRKAISSGESAARSSLPACYFVLKPNALRGDV